MTERDYLDAKALGHVSSAVSALQNVVADNLRPEHRDDFKAASKGLYRLQEKLFKCIEIDDQ